MSPSYAYHLRDAADVPPWKGAAVSCDLSQLASLENGESQRGFNLIAARWVCDLRQAEAAAAITPALPLLASCGAALHVELTSSDQYDKPSSPRAMPAAAAVITELAKHAAGHRVKMALSPRLGHWMQRIEDAVRVAMRVNRADVGVVFNFGHWHAVDGDASLLDQRIKLALPKLMAVTVPVQWRGSDEPWQVTTLAGQPLDFERLKRLLVAGGYRGPVILEPVTPQPG